MNERIRELQIQAEAAADEIFDRQGKMYSEIVMEKFAQLIVAECIDAATEAQADFYIVHNIKSRFGVEE
jgi:hypothetical protein